MGSKGFKKGICVIIPAYNEAAVLGSVLAGLPSFIEFKGQQIPVEVVVVNDGSTDKTVEVVAAKPHVILLNHVLNSGAGGATRTGLRYARENNFDFAITMDADGQHDVEDVIKVAQAAMQGKADFIIGSRLIDSSGMPWHRVVGNMGLNVIAFILFGIKVTDVQSGLRALNRRAIKKVDFRSNSFAFCPEMIWVAHMQKLRIAEVPVRAIYTEYSLSKGQLGQKDITAGIRVVRQLIKQRLMGFLDE